jgi:ComF family protein
MLGMQRALAVIYPPQCQMCASFVAEEGGLCGDCWSKTPFLKGLVCNTCGTSLPGSEGGEVLCDDCLLMPRPWQTGRAALSYRDLGRRFVLALKHGDRLDLAGPAARWMLTAGKPFIDDQTVFVPIPVHWSRLLRRRYNQAAELTKAMSKASGLPHCPDMLIRTRRTPKQDGMTADERMRNLDRALSVNPKRVAQLRSARVCLVDDVMTSGATMSTATEALNGAGIDNVSVLLLARVEKSP